MLGVCAVCSILTRVRHLSSDITRHVIELFIAIAHAFHTMGECCAKENIKGVGG